MAGTPQALAAPVAARGAAFASHVTDRAAAHASAAARGRDDAEALTIVHVVRQFAPAIGGIEDYVLQLARRQVAAGHRVRVVTLDRLFDDPARRRLPARETIEGIAVRRLRWFGSKRYPIALAAPLAVRGADIVHVHGVDFLSDWLALTVPLHRRRMLLSTHGGFFHTGFAARAKRLWFGSVTRLVLTRYAGVIASSQADAALFAPLRRAGVETIENGVALGKFEARADPDAKRIIYFGRLAPNKGIDHILGWFRRVHAIDRSWRLTIAGREAGVTGAQILGQAARLGLDSAVAVHLSPDDDALAALIARCSAYVSASRYEGFGLAAVEAAAAGLYPVLSAIPPFRRTVERIGWGMLLDFEAPGAAAEFLARWRDERTRPAGADEASLEAAFGWGGCAEAIELVYRRALGRSERRLGAVRVAVVERRDALAEVGARHARREGQIVAFCNQHMINLARRDAALRAALDGAFVLNDGVGADLLSRLLYGRRFPDNLNGTDLIPAMLDSLRSARVFLIGSPPGVAKRAGGVWAARYPHHRFVGAQHGFFAAGEEDALVARIAAARADLVIVGMGQPRQELLAERLASRLPVVTWICGGAILDFAAGAVPRAPALVRRLRLEWLYRLTREPRRMVPRYVTGGFAFALMCVRQWAQGARI